jgi:aspartyl-tRNA(Asn)/glutamyl-tRNA(Gln) amidotransferase subunit C
MTLSTKEVKHIYKLARIEEENLDETAIKLNEIFGMIQPLAEVNTDGVEPMTGIGNNSLRMREDEADLTDIKDKVLANAPASLLGYFVVPKIVE